MSDDLISRGRLTIKKSTSKNKMKRERGNYSNTIFNGEAETCRYSDVYYNGEVEVNYSRPDVDNFSGGF